MTRLRGVLQSSAAFGMLCLTLCLSQGCVRPEPLHPDSDAAVGEQKLPFHPDADQPPASLAADPRPNDQDRVPLDPKLATGLPFRAGAHLRVLPSGTLLTVQLEDSLSSTKVRTGDAFTAFVAAPLTMDGEIVIARGAVVAGRVESAQLQSDHPGLVPSSGYFRLTLNAITVEGRQLTLQTSSLFARASQQQWNGSSLASPSDLRPEDIQVQKGRRLTFRLLRPVVLDDPNSMADRRSPGSIPE